MITLDELEDLLNYNPNTGIFTNRIDRGYQALAGKPTGSYNSSGYIVLKIKQERYMAHRLAWFYVTGNWPKDKIDHINGIRDDNKFSNLREATVTQNNANTKPSKGYRKRGDTYQAYISINNKFVSLGTFKKEEEAAEAYKKAHRKIHGEFSRC
jgi:hypothetical protein